MSLSLDGLVTIGNKKVAAAKLDGGKGSSGRIAIADADGNVSFGNSKSEFIKGNNITSTDLVVTGGTGAVLKDVTLDIKNGGVSNEKLVNSKITLGNSEVSLGGTLTTITGLTSVTSTGFTGALTGNASTATSLATKRKINGVEFEGGADITISSSAPNALTIGNYLTGTSYNGSAAVTIAADATSASTPSKLVARDVSGNFSAGTITAALTGNATSATTASNLAGTTIGSIPYQSAVGTTGYTALGTSGQVLKSSGTGAPVWASLTSADLPAGSTNYVASNTAITGGTKLKITYDAKGLVTAGADATTADIATSTDKNYVTDAQKTVIGNTSGTNSGDNAVNTLYSGLVSNATHTGDATGSTALTLATVNPNVGSFGSSTSVPTITVNGKGLVTAVSSTTIPSATNAVNGLLTSADWTTFNGKANLVSPSFTTPTLGVASATSVSYSGSTSGTTTLRASAVAGTTTITMPAKDGTLVTTINAGTTGDILVRTADGAVWGTQITESFTGYTNRTNGTSSNYSYTYNLTNFPIGSNIQVYVMGIKVIVTSYTIGNKSVVFTAPNISGSDIVEFVYIK